VRQPHAMEHVGILQGLEFREECREILRLPVIQRNPSSLLGRVDQLLHIVDLMGVAPYPRRRSHVGLL